MPTYCNADGSPNPNGRYELVDGQIRPRKTLRDGEHLSFEVALFNSASGRLLVDGKAIEPPKTIDEALKAVFKSAAEAAGVPVADYLAGLQPHQLEKIVSETAVAFVQASAGKGVAAQFADSASATTAARKAAYEQRSIALLGAAAKFTADERLQVDNAAAHAAMVHRSTHAYLGDRAPAFTDNHRQAAREAAIAAILCAKRPAAPPPGLATDADVAVAHTAMVTDYLAPPGRRGRHIVGRGA